MAVGKKTLSSRFIVAILWSMISNQLFAAVAVNVDSQEVEEARTYSFLSLNIYSEKSCSEDAIGSGWICIKHDHGERMNIHLLENPFHAAVYENSPDPSLTTEIVVVFEGTRATSLGDWLTNLSHAAVPVIPPEQYLRASNLALEYGPRAKDSGVRITFSGHSLGGGLAQHAALKLSEWLGEQGSTREVSAYVFNSAGLWPSTNTKNPKCHSSKLPKNFRVHSFIGSAYVNGNEEGVTDLVERIGCQTDKNPVSIKIDVDPGLVVKTTADTQMVGPIFATKYGQSTEFVKMAKAKELYIANPLLYVKLHSMESMNAAMGGNSLPDPPLLSEAAPNGQEQSIKYKQCSNDPVEIRQFLDRYKPLAASPLVALPVSTIVEWAGRDKFLNNAKNLYADAQDFQFLSVKAAGAAQRCLDSDNIQLACEYRDKMTRYDGLSKSLATSAINLYVDTIDIAKSEVIYKSALAAMGAFTLYAGPLLGPAAAKALPAGHKFTALVGDYYLDKGLGYEGEAEVNLAMSVVSDLLVHSIVPSDMGKGVTQSWGKSGAYEYMHELVGSSAFKDKAVKYVMSTSGRLSREAAEKAVQTASDAIVKVVMEPTMVGDDTARSDIISGLWIPNSICADQRSDSGVSATALVVDRSGSMKTTVTRSDNTTAQRLEVAKEALRAYVSTLESTDRISISSFANSADTQLKISEGKVASVESKLNTYLGKIQLAGGTNIGSGLSEGFKQLSDSGAGERIALLLSDGENTTGEYKIAVEKYKEAGWPVCTIGFGTQAGEVQLKYIAEQTGCTYSYANAENLIDAYQELSSYAQNRELILKAADLLPPDGSVSYPFTVYAEAESLRAYSSWAGSTLRSVLTDPSGNTYSNSSVGGSIRFEEGATFQMLEIKQPEPGQWSLVAAWSVPPATPEQINITVSEKTDVFVRTHGLRPHYAVGERVEFKVDAMEVVGSRKQPLLNASVVLTVQKPEPELIRMIQAQSSNWTMYRDVAINVSRDVLMIDDGAHDDRSSGDGIFAGVFVETDINGPFLYSVTITGQHRDGRRAERTITGSFQVGSILQNPVTASAVMTYQSGATTENVPIDPYSNDVIRDPLEQIEDMEGDALDSIEDLLR